MCASAPRSSARAALQPNYESRFSSLASICQPTLLKRAISARCSRRWAPSRAGRDEGTPRSRGGRREASCYDRSRSAHRKGRLPAKAGRLVHWPNAESYGCSAGQSALRTRRRPDRCGESAAMCAGGASGRTATKGALGDIDRAGSHRRPRIYSPLCPSAQALRVPAKARRAAIPVTASQAAHRR